MNAHVYHLVIAPLIVLLTLSIPVQADSVDEELAMIQQEVWAQGYDWTVARTWLMELSPEERARLCGLSMPDDFIEPQPDPMLETRSLPARFDWRDQNKVSPVKNQFSCGSCWAFAPLAALESMVMIRAGWTPDLSEQQMVSCNTKGYSCNGGWLDVADHFVNPGCVEEACMPYEARDGVSCIENSCGFTVRASSWQFVGSTIDGIKNALQEGPVAAAMHVYSDFYSYGGGCYEHAGNDAVDHGVLIVGWDDTICGGAWIIKNSWGRRWGENGFAYVKFNTCKLGTGAMKIGFAGSNPTATFTPTPEANYTPTPLPTAAPAYTLYLELNKTNFRGGDTLVVSLALMNQGPQSSALMYFMLEYGGQFFFYPEWWLEPRGVGFTVPDYYQGTFELLRLTLPRSLPAGGPFTFHIGCLWFDTVYLASNISSASFYFY